MEGRGYTDLCRNTSEEWFIKSMMESSIGMPAAASSPPMEVFGSFDSNNNNLSQSFRADSEELFNHWLINSENNGGIAHRTRNMISAETTPNSDLSCEPNHLVTMNTVDKGTLQASNLFLAKAWFNSSQPMTRSRSSELKRRYVQHNMYTSIGMEAMNNNMNSIDANTFKHEHTDPNGIINAPITEFPSFMSPSNSSSYADNNNITSVVNMLKGTLESKKIYQNDEAVGESPFGYYGGCDEMLTAATGLNQVQTNHTYNSYQNASYGIGVYGVPASTNHFQRSRETSQSESSLVVSAGFDTCESSKKQMVIEKSSGNDHTKKRRVERSRKMAEAKEKSTTPAAANSDMQSLLKRCENLEKEVRSLKLNLAFMNRKDSEQTKQTEELQKQNDELSKEKGRLLEEIERIISQTDHKM